MFNGIKYFLDLANANKLAGQNNFLVSTTSDLHTIEPMMDNFQTVANFVMVMDTVDGSMVGGRPGWFNRRAYTVAIVSRYEWDNSDDRNKKLAVCREIYRQMLTHILQDQGDYEMQDNPIYFRTNDMSYREMQPYAMAGATGVVFSLNIDEPADLTYNPDDWQA